MKVNRALLLCPSIRQGGMETYVRTEVNELTKQGYRVCIYSFGECNKEIFAGNQKLNIVEGFTNPNSPDSFLLNFSKLKELFAKEPYQLIHAHDHHSLLLSSCLASILEVPLLVTFHSTFSFLEKKDPFELFLHQLIISKVINKALLLSEEMEKKIFLQYSQIDKTIFRNPICVPDPLPVPHTFASEQKKILIVSRLDKDKKKSVETALQVMREIFPKSFIYVAGEGMARQELEKSILPEDDNCRISFLGYKNDLKELYGLTDIVVGMGRVILEGLSYGKISILSGYEGVVGVVTPQNYDSFKSSNFSGRGLILCEDLQQLRRDIHALTSADLAHLQSLVSQEFNARTSWTNIIRETSYIKEKNIFKDFFSILLIAIEEAKKNNDESVFSSTVTRDIIANFLFSNPKYKDLIQPFIYYENKSKEQLIKRLEEIQGYLKRDLNTQEQLSKKLIEELADKKGIIDSQQEKLRDKERTIKRLQEQTTFSRFFKKHF